MPFNKLIPLHQGLGPRCGAACAVFVLHWLRDIPITQVADGVSQTTGEELDRAMRLTSFTRLTEALGSTPANIADYIKTHYPAARIYAPSEMLKNWSGRPWYPALRAGLQSCRNLELCSGSKRLMPAGNVGQQFMVIKMVSKSWALSPADYGQCHFVVQVSEHDIMNPMKGSNEDKDAFLTGGAFSTGWKSIGLDLYVYR